MRKPYAIGIDIGGTNTVFGIVDARGNILGSSSIKTLKHSDVEAFLDELHTELTALMTRTGAVDKVHGIGVGAPGADRNGVIEYAENLPWKMPVRLAKLISDKFGIPAKVTNDANAAAIGEMTYGVARGINDFIMITLGTGVGSGVVCDGKLVEGHNGLAGELGHAIVRPVTGRMCGCGRIGCLETYCSATGVARTAKEFLETHHGTPSSLRNIDVNNITSKDVYDAAMDGDELAKEIFEFTGNMLGEALANFATFSDPEAFVIFGGLAKSGNLLLDPVKAAFEKNVISLWKGKVKILLSELKDADAALLGASAVGWTAKDA